MKTRYRFVIPALMMVVLSACGKAVSDDADASAPTSAAVITQRVQTGRLANVISAYGTAMPSVGAVTTLNIHAEGSVTRFDVTAGMPVQRGQQLLTFSLSPVAASAYRQARSALDVAHAEREHTAQLLQRQLATRDQLAQADKALDDARSALDALRKQQGDAAVVELRAPFDGIVASIAVTQGDMLQAGAPLLSLTRGNDVVVTVGVEADAQHPVKVSDAVTLVPLGRGPSLQGVVKRVGGMLDPHTHLLNTDITPASPVMPGMGYRADIEIGEWSGWLVPRDAMVGDDDAWHVFQVADGKAVEVPVTVVGESDSVAVVSGALDAKRALVVVGNTQLENGMAVRVTAQAEAAK